MLDRRVLPWDKQPIRVAVVGDLILDEYLDGLVNRISPEAPVPVHLVRNTMLTAGGAANVARNIQLAGGVASLIGVCGNDNTAEQLRALLSRDGINLTGIFTDPKRPTVKKTRITANHQQLVRIDWEEVKPIEDELQDLIARHVASQEWDALLLSDYGKGGLPRPLVERLIKIARDRSRPVIVDPKGFDYSAYAGATMITPNRKEATEALGRDTKTRWDARDLAQELHLRYGLDTVLVTLGAEGMFGLDARSQSELYLPAVTREVFDVSGAGDTVVALMALSLGAGVNFADGMRYANAGAGKVVEKWGTHPITREELLEALEQDQLKQGSGFDSCVNRIVTVETLRAIVGPMGKRKRKVVFTNGCFDILHAGHVSYLEQARALGQLLVVGVNTDDSVRRLKGSSRPLVSLQHRMQLLAALRCVDFVVSFSEDTPAKLIHDVAPDILVKGADYELEDIVGADQVLASGGRVERISFVEGLSTSAIVKRVRDGEGC